jgi:hypothetical protein
MRTMLPVLLLASGLAAQSVIIPSAAATIRPTRQPFFWANMFYSTTSTTTPHDSRTQSIVATSDIAPAAALWNSLGVRRPVGLGNANPVTSTTGTIMMSVSTMPYTAMTNNFATNHGPSPVTVFTGTINLPAETNPPTWPANWNTIPFTAPFPYTNAMGPSLVIDLKQVGNTATTAWYVEVTSPNLGNRLENGGPQSTCKFSNGNYNSGLSYTTAGIGGNGGPWYVTYNSLLPNTVGVAAIGVQGVGGNWNGIPLPYSLASLGAPGCTWNVSVEFMVGLATNATGSATWPTQTIPNDPALRGAFFYDHSAFVDAAANALGLVVGWSSKWEIGTQLGAPGCSVSATGTTANNPTGTLQQGFLATLQLNP